jgi:hypothetical protein
VLVFGHRQPGRRPIEYSSLYRLADAAPKRSATPAQRKAIERALAARRTCQQCGAEQDYYLSTVSRMCGPCSDATGFWDDHHDTESEWGPGAAEHDDPGEAVADGETDGWWVEHEAAMRAEDRHRPVTDIDLADREVDELAEHEAHQPAEVDSVAGPAQWTTEADGPSPAVATGAVDARVAVADPATRDDETTRAVERAHHALTRLAQRRTTAEPRDRQHDRGQRLARWHADDQTAEQQGRELEGVARWPARSRCLACPTRPRRPGCGASRRVSPTWCTSRRAGTGAAPSTRLGGAPTTAAGRAGRAWE